MTGTIGNRGLQNCIQSKRTIQKQLTSTYLLYFPFSLEKDRGMEDADGENKNDKWGFNSQ